MKSLLIALILCALTATTALAERNDYNPYQNNGQQDAARNAGSYNQRYVDGLIRKEIERRKARQGSPRRSRSSNCGKSFWTKREALGLCPPATAMKVRQGGEVFYYCDCE